MKIAGRGELERERERLAWAAARLSVPRVLGFVHDHGREYLLLDELAGVPLELADELSMDARVDAAAMRRVHDLPAGECLFDSRLAVRLADAEARVRAGLVDVDDFDVERRGRSAESVLEEVRSLAGRFEEDPTVTHGD